MARIYRIKLDDNIKLDIDIDKSTLCRIENGKKTCFDLKNKDLAEELVIGFWDLGYEFEKVEEEAMHE